MKRNIGVLLLLFVSTTFGKTPECGPFKNSTGVSHPSIDSCKGKLPKPLEKGITLIAFAKSGAINALAVLHFGNLIPAKEELSALLPKIYELPNEKSHRAKCLYNYDDATHNGCYWYGAFAEAPPDDWTILTTDKTLKISTDVSENLRKLFYSINRACVKQGDGPPGKEPPCVKPKLVATSDLNKNGRTEFWHTTPYMWDTGFAVSEMDVENKKLKSIAAVCSGCSD